MVRAFPGGIAHLDNTLVFTFCNEAQAAYFGCSVEEVIGRSLHEVVPDRTSFWTETERAAVTRERFAQAAPSITLATVTERDGHHFLLRYIADLDPRGHVRGVFVTALEMTQPPRPENETERALRERNSALEETIKERDLLVGIISHELRNPLGSIFGNAQLLLRRLEDLDVDSRTQAIDDIRTQAERLNRLVENMLLLARAGAQAPVPTEPIVVEQAIDEVVIEHRKQFGNRSISVSVLPSSLVTEAQPDYLKQVLQNLLGNAEKYSPADEPIDVQASRRGEEVVVSILDRGPGIDPAEAEIIFQPFYRSARTASKVTGAGIGLAVCKLLVQAQSGSVATEPRPGGGSVFTFTLPAGLQRSSIHPRSGDRALVASA